MSTFKQVPAPVNYSYQAIFLKKKGTDANAKETIASCDQRILVGK